MFCTYIYSHSPACTGTLLCRVSDWIIHQLEKIRDDQDRVRGVVRFVTPAVCLSRGLCSAPQRSPRVKPVCENYHDHLT